MIKPFLKKKLQVNKQLVKGLVIYVAPNWPISPKLLTLTHFAKRERERNGTEGSRTPPRSCATPSRSETAAMACHVITRRRSSLQRGGRRKSPRRRQRFPQSRSFQGLCLLFLPLLLFFLMVCCIVIV